MWTDTLYGDGHFAEPQVQPHGQQQPPGNVLPLLNTKPGAGTDQANRDQHNQSNDPPGQTDYLPYWLIALTLLQAIILFFQTVYTRDAANAAKGSAQVARDALALVERPSLAPEKWELDIARDANRRPDGLICTLRNVGRTPATVTEGAIGFMNWGKTPSHLMIADPDIVQEGLFTVYPQGVLDYVLPFDAEYYWRLGLETGPHNRTYFYGHVLYTDEFNNLHCLRFCVVENTYVIPVKEGSYNYTETTKKQEEKKSTWYARILRKKTE